MTWTFITVGVLLLVSYILILYLFIAINETKTFDSLKVKNEITSGSLVTGNITATSVIIDGESRDLPEVLLTVGGNVEAAGAKFTDLEVTGSTTFNNLDIGGALTASNLTGTNTGDQNVFTAVNANGTVIQSSGNDTLKLTSGPGISISTNPSNKEVILDTSFTATNSFRNIAIPSQTTVTALSPNSTLNLVPGNNISLTTNNISKTITISSSGAGGAAFDKFTVNGQSDIDATTSSSVEFVAGNGVTLTTAGNALTIDAAAGSQNTFTSIQVPTQSPIVANSNNTALNFVSGTGMSLTTDVGAKTVTFNSTVTQPNGFSSVAVSSQPVVSASQPGDSINFVAGNGINITTNATNKSVTISSPQMMGGGAFTKTIPQTVDSGTQGVDSTAITFENTVFNSSVIQPSNSVPGASFVNNSSLPVVATVSYSIRFQATNTTGGYISNSWIQKLDTDFNPVGPFYAQNFQNLAQTDGDVAFTGTATIQLLSGEQFAVYMFQNSGGVISVGGTQNWYTCSLSFSVI